VPAAAQTAATAPAIATAVTAVIATATPAIATPVMNATTIAAPPVIADGTVSSSDSYYRQLQLPVQALLCGAQRL